MRSGTWLRPNTIKALGDDPEDYVTLTDNYILLDRLEILPRYRGKGVGMWSIQEILGYLSHALSVSFFALKPAPLQANARPEYYKGWSKRMRYGQLSSDIAASKEKLKGLYAGLGFIAVKGTDFMVCDASVFAPR